MATVRIYKVAELLSTSSQEVMSLLKKEHGIEVKSASSTIEEVVARQFVERLARQRGITLPPVAAMFADAPVSKGRKPSGKAPEPKPTGPVLPPPRLIKTLRPHPVPPPDEGVTAVPGDAVAEVHVDTGAPAPAIAVDAAAAAAQTAPALDAREPALGEAPAAAEPMAAPAPVAPAPAAAAEPAEPAEPAAVAPAAAATEAPDAPAPVEPAETVSTPEPHAPTHRPAAPGRLVPPSIRLRIEDPSQPIVEGPSRSVPRPPLRPAAPPAAPVPAQPAIAARAPGAPAQGPRPVPQGPAPARPPLGGPRPVPTQPVRTGTGGLPGVKSPFTAPRPSYAPTGYVAPARPATGQVARPATGPRPPATGPRPAPPRPVGRPSGARRAHDARERMGAAAASAPLAPPPVTRSITLAEGMTVKDLADKLDVKVKDVLKKLIEKRMMLTINSTLDTPTALMIAREFGADVQMRTFEQEVVEAEGETTRPEDLATRAPVVTVMGHVDHGKTTLLDAIRETHVAEREAGGITQHIGAYAVNVNNRRVVFLDTPGHEAFTMMRSRGAKVTDVVILVVAADDGVMPQTREAIDHARAANVPIIVAINKIDKADANPDRVKKELADLGLVPEDWGGQTVMVAVSAKKHQNLELLLEMILLVTEIAELKANPKRNATGTVLEAKLDKGRGPVATVLVQDGTLHVGDNFIAGTIVGKVRALIDDRGRTVKSAPPSSPVEVLGLGGLPQPGDTFQSIADAAKARQIAMFRQIQAKERQLVTKTPRSLEDLGRQIAAGGIKELPIVIKADVQGSAEVLADSLTKLSSDQVKIRIIHAGVGAVNESDVLLASASDAIVVGFNVRPDRNATDVAEREKVDIRLHSVIYNVTDEIKKAMAGLLEPTFKEVRLGVAEVRQLFKVPKFGTVAGCIVSEGVIRRSGEAQARLLRDHVVIHEGKLGSLRRFKDDVSEVKAGFECGIAFERYNDLKTGDVIEAFTVERVEAAAS